MRIKFSSNLCRDMHKVVLVENESLPVEGVDGVSVLVDCEGGPKHQKLVQIAVNPVCSYGF